MKKQILIATISDYGNLGNRLQNYAVNESLKRYGTVTGGMCRSHFYWEYLLKLKIMKFPNIPYLSKKLWGKRYKKYLFWNFSSRISVTKQYFDHNEETISKNFKWIFYGSDQIWNPEFGLKNCIIPKTPKEKNIAICASIGTDYIPEERTKEYKDGLLKFRYISVREDRAAEIVNNLIGVKPEVLIDPTLALDRQKWEKIERRPYYGSAKEWKKKKYILIYFLGNLSQVRWAQIKKFVEKNNAEAIDATKGKIANDIGPAEFIWLIHHSYMVITDSYHGSIFSFLFNKAFYVLDREDDEIKLSMNSRFDTLFRKLNLYDRRNNNIDTFMEEHDYRHSYELLEKEKKKYFAFIYKVMESADKR